MGFFDRFTAKKPAPTTPAPAPSEPVPPAAPTPVATGGIQPRLAAAREKLTAKDLAGAMAIYEEVLAAAGDRADVLVAISGDLGSNGHIPQIIELIAPRYDADRHGPATGLNLLQAYLAMRDAEAAQHVLDILFALNRPELEDRLHGFSNAIAEILNSPGPVGPAAGGAGAGPAGSAKIGLITISKPIWFYGLEAMTAQLLPPKEGRLRRIAFAQLSLPGHVTPPGGEARRPEDELGRLSRALPLWFAETFYFSPLYAPVAAIGVMTPAEGPSHHVTFSTEWTTENLRQLVDSTEGGLDYIVTGALRGVAGDYDVILRVWEVKTYRERKTFTVRWTPSTADESLTQLHSQVRTYMEWSPSSAAFAYTIPTQPRGWIDTLGASLGLFLVEKNILPREQLAPVGDDLRAVAQRAGTNEAAALAYLTLSARAAKLGVAPPEGIALARSPLVLQAQKAVS